jgi:hypothetical protein
MADRHFTLESFVAFTASGALEAELPFIAAAEAATEVLAKNALLVFGDNAKLAPLAAATQAEREAKGFSPDEPLFESGELLYDKVEQLHSGMEAAIGSPEIVQLYHEMGYTAPRSGIVPARPVFKTALDDSEEEIEALLEAACGAALGLTSAPARIEREAGYRKI